MRLLVGERGPQMLLVTDSAGALQGVVTKTDILRAVRMSDEPIKAGRVTRRMPKESGGERDPSS